MSTSSNTLSLPLLPGRKYISRQWNSFRRRRMSEDPSSCLNEIVEAVTIDDEDDYTGYFLEPTANAANIVERIAEANRKLYEEDVSTERNADRPKKVQFSEDIVNFEPYNFDSDELDESDGTISEEDAPSPDEEDKELSMLGREKLHKRSYRPKTANRNPGIKEEDEEEVAAEEAAAAAAPITTPPPTEEEEEEDAAKTDEVAEEIKPEEPCAEESDHQLKVLLVMLPRERSSSCESVIGEDIPGGETTLEAPPPTLPETADKPVTVPEVTKPAKSNAPCKVSKITPNLTCSASPENRKSWHASRSQGLKLRKKKVEETVRPKSSVGGKDGGDSDERPKTAPEKRCCCGARTGLPQYNGLRSEYGLSAEQLQERRRKTFELRQQKRVDRMKKRQEEMRKKIENEENFSRWLYSKRRGACTTAKKETKQVDTLSRSDVYIQNHAVYASRRGVTYSVDYGLGRKKHQKTGRVLLLERKHEKSINLDRLFDNVASHVKHTYRIYLGGGVGAGERK